MRDDQYLYLDSMIHQKYPNIMMHRRLRDNTDQHHYPQHVKSHSFRVVLHVSNTTSLSLACRNIFEYQHDDLHKLFFRKKEDYLRKIKIIAQ